MSNSIWKTPNQKPDKNCPIVFRNDIGVIYCALDPKSAFLMRPDDKWAYLHEVVAQADKVERLQKAVDLAVDALKDIQMTYVVHYDNGAIRFRDAKDIAVRTKKEIKQLIKEI